MRVTFFDRRHGRAVNANTLIQRSGGAIPGVTHWLSVQYRYIAFREIRVVPARSMRR